jgi:hypothetical protein
MILMESRQLVSVRWIPPSARSQVQGSQALGLVPQSASTSMHMTTMDDAYRKAEMK